MYQVDPSYNYMHELKFLLTLPIFVGLALLQARKFLDCAQQLGSYGHPYPWPTFPSGSPSLAGCSDTSTDFESAVSRFHRPGITVRYIFCENLFQRYVTEERISSLDPMKDTLNGLCKLIGSKERIDRDLELELFSHEGYPFNANMYTMDRKSLSEICVHQMQ